MSACDPVAQALCRAFSGKQQWELNQIEMTQRKQRCTDEQFGTIHNQIIISLGLQIDLLYNSHLNSIQLLSMITTRLLENLKDVRNVFFHPKGYTALFITDKCLYYYDLLALTQIFMVYIFSIDPNEEAKDLKVVFTTNFNEMYIMLKNIIVKLNKNPNGKVDIRKNQYFLPEKQKSRVRFFSIFQNHYLYLIEKSLHLQSLRQEDKKILNVELKGQYQIMKMLDLNEAESEIKLIASYSNSMELIYFKYGNKTQHKLRYVYKIDFDDTVYQFKIDFKHKKIGVLLEFKRTIMIINYDVNGLYIIQRIRIQYPVKDFTFFSYSQNADTVNSLYRSQYVVLASQMVNECRIELASITKYQNAKLTHVINKKVENVYFNSLFDNSFIALTSQGQLYLNNLYGYNKEWITLGLKFVHIQNNQLYFEKENDFQIQYENKKTHIRSEQLDDYSLSFFSEAQYKARLKIKRLQLDW